ncbi:hypothetical protein BJV78DRAFT_1350436 [Lactifluus subvellereus]|nr:hypothetical protein BJV78DRAFT_1350436 [Lactifluus subvellereus]
MLAPFSFSGVPEPKYVILTRGGARTRRDASAALGDVTNLPSGPLPPTRPPLTSSSLPVRKPPPPVTIFTNPARRARPPSAQEVQTTQPQNHPSPAPKRAPASILKAPVPAQARGSSVAAAAGVETRNRTRPTTKLADPAKGEHRPKQLLPKIVIHEPFWWDSWTDVHQPGSSYGETLDVPAINRCGKMYEDDMARYYPTEYSAEQTMERLRSMVRSGRRLAAARRRERARQDKQAGTPASSTDARERSSATRRATPPRSRFSP